MIKSFYSIISLLLAGSFLFSTGGALPAAGGEASCFAEESRRAVIEREILPFTLKSPAGEKKAELSLTLLRKGDTRTEVRREWVTAEDDILALSKQNARDAVNAELSFGKNGFTYTPEQKGVYCDFNASLKNALAAVEAGERESELVCVEYAPKITLASLKERTQRLGSFTTYFDGGNLPRAHNIALAAARISGTVIEPHAEFSFNESVGKRTEENGFEVANVIFDGQFVPGVGGGVCQASTTLMNAALYSGLKITESRPHSLSVSYVKPSLDAMVSEYSDLKFINPYAFPVYLAAKTGENFVRFTFYGKPDGKRYETESSVRYRIAPPPAETVEGEEDKVLRAEKEGLASESYLLVYDETGALISRTLLRRDTYAAQQGKYQIAPPKEEEAQEEAEEAPYPEKIFSENE